MLKTAQLVVTALTISSAVAWDKWAQVHEYIQDDHCKEHYISKHRPACVTQDGHCHPPGHQGDECEDVETWQWHHADDEYLQYAPGVLPPPHRRITHAGHAKQKTVWAYASAITQGLATQVYGPDRQVTVAGTLNAPINQIAFIANIQSDKPAHWFNPGQNDTDGCGQKQTWELPYGFDGQDLEHATQRFIQNLTLLKQNGITITLTMASWCTSFPLREWTTTEFTQFVNYFKELREDYFGGHLDGIDFDWEGFCDFTCLHEICTCDWDEAHCNDKTPEELAAGVYYYVEDTSPKGPHKPMRVQCWLLPVKETLQVMGGIAYYMKKAGFLVTLVPMSVSAWTGEEDKSEKQNLKNEYVKWRINHYEGNEFNILEAADGMLLQWYSGFDAGLCGLVDDPSACQCDNIQVPDYPNWHNNTAEGPEHSGLLYNYALIDAVGSNTFPSVFPVRCQSCGPSVMRPNGTRGPLQCYPDGEDYMLPGDWETYPQLIQEHQQAWRNYTESTGSSGRPGLPYWFMRNFTYLGRCPRSVDCPDWRYEKEEPYSRMTKMLYSLDTVISMDKISIGFETLGNDQHVQLKSYTDPLLPFSTASPEDHEAGNFYKKCDTNITRTNLDQGWRCGAPTQQQQWGALFNASEIVGIEAKIRKDHGKEMAGVGVFTIDGFLWEKDPKDQRLWYQPLCDLNKDYRIKCDGECCKDSHWEGLATPAHLIDKTNVENPFIF